jgi:phenylalanyl-tRNA synthetase alpha chain
MALSEKGIGDLLARARADIDRVKDSQQLEECRRRYLGRKSELRLAMQGLGSLSATDKRMRGALLNRARSELTEQLEAHASRLLATKHPGTHAMDLSIPARARYLGGAHPLSLTRRRIQELFLRTGFDVVEGPEVEDEYYNFDALNIPADHPARAMHDTMYLQNGSDENRLLLRSHTSPAQIRTLLERKPPLRIISPGRVYRCDFDLTHTPMFHQVEGLWVDQGISMANLRGLLTGFLQNFFDKGDNLQVRFRPSYFPFTEPSAEVDIACVRCDGEGCRVCANTGWLEVMGCGMVHPNVLNGVGLKPRQWPGLAFGMGIERLSMLYYGIDDLRMFFESAPRFLSQFLGRAR